MEIKKGGKDMVICVIPAKKDSKRLPGKNMIELNGRPLIDYTIDFAKKSKMIKEIFVSTDSDEIVSYVKQKGLKTILRDSSLGGEAELMDVYEDAMNKINRKDVSYVVGLQVDHPDRNIDLDGVIRYAIDNHCDDVVSVDKNAKRNGSLRIMSMNSLSARKLSRRLAVVKDNSTNIHTESDLIFASYRLKRMNSIRVEDKEISVSSPVFIIAEAANNHMCDIDRAKLMIDKAKEAGADAVKFQTYKAERLVVRTAKSYWSYAGTAKSQYEYYKNLDKFNEEDYRVLFEYAHKKNIICFSTPFDVESARMLNDLEVPLFKIASACIPDKRLLKYIAKLNKPIILSTGGSTLKEIHEAIFTILEQGNDKLVLLACTLSYPTSNNNANILRVRTLSEEFPDFIIGLSDHTEPDANMVIPSLGVALGARVIEKHYTLDRKMTGSGHSFSVEPDDLKKMVYNIRLTEGVLGSGQLDFIPSEESARQGARGSIVANRKIKKGEAITDDMIAIKRPGTGLPANLIDELIGKTANFDIEEDTQIKLDQLK